MIDGMPINQDGKYNLEDISSDMIEKIEIVRSGGSVLYGSEASGGVINIITRKNVGNKVKVSVGNLGRQNYSVNVSGGGFSASAFLEKRGDINRTSTTAVSGRGASKVKKYYRYDDGERKGIRWNYDINENLIFTHQYSKNDNKVSQISPDGGYVNGVLQTNDYRDTDNTFQLRFDDKNGLKANVSYGTQEKEYYQSKWNKNSSLSSSGLYSWRKGHNTNLDVQKTFEMGPNKFLIGASYKKEDMDIIGSNAGAGSVANYGRDTYSIYASYDWAMTDKDNLAINMRETFARNCSGEYTDKTVEKDNMDKFTPEVQYIRRINDSSSVYAKIGKSFRLPELTRIYGSSVILPSEALKPEQGTHYEMGYKLNDGNAAWRLAIYKYVIDDAIESTGSASAENLRYYNADVKSYGMELTCDIKHDEYLSSSYGLAISNPKKKSDDEVYEKYGNRLQFNASVNYLRNKLGASLMANYFGKRLDSDVDEHAGFKVKPALYTDLHLTYAPEKEHKFFFHLNNIFDRDDLTTDTAPLEDRLGYLSVGRNFMVGYEYSF